MKNIGDSRSVLFSVSYQTFTTNLGESHEWLIVLLFCNKLIFWACEEGKGEEVTAFNMESTTRGGGRGGDPPCCFYPPPQASTVQYTAILVGFYFTKDIQNHI